MSSLKPALLSICLCAISAATIGAQPAGPLASWRFDEGRGNVARNGRDAKLFGASWVKQRDCFAISLGGVDDYIEFARGPAPGISGLVSIEAWVKPVIGR